MYYKLTEKDIAYFNLLPGGEYIKAAYQLMMDVDFIEEKLKSETDCEKLIKMKDDLELFKRRLRLPIDISEDEMPVLKLKNKLRNCYTKENPDFNKDEPKILDIVDIKKWEEEIKSQDAFLATL